MNSIYRYSVPGLLCIFLLSACAEPAPSPTQPTPPRTLVQTSNSDALFIGISIVDQQTVWISGTDGSYGRTQDGGTTWQINTVPGADSLQFRDVHAIDAETAYLLSIGNGDASRIYKTIDGGQSWDLQYLSDDPSVFLDCMDFWDPDHGIAFSDSHNNQFHLIQTEDGGKNWTRIPPDQFPPALDSEGSFAASGTCLMTRGDSTAWIGTGAGGKARVLMTDDRGATWTITETPVAHGTPSSGLASVSFLDDQHAAVGGGEIAAPDSTADTIAITTDGGASWTNAAHLTFTGAVYGLSYVPNQTTPTIVAAGPKGIDYSTDNGASWQSIATDNYWSVAFHDSGAGWATGTDGKTLRIDF